MKTLIRASDDYERFIATLLRNLKETNRRITELGYGGNNTIQGASGQSHQVDVSFIDHDFPNPTLVLIECKRLNKKIDLQHVKVLKATLDDILAAEDTPSDANAMLVTTVGARSGPERYADYYGIRIEQVSHGPDYTFRYEDVVQAGVTNRLKFSQTATYVLVRKCHDCGERFDVQDKEALCASCGPRE